MKHGYTVSDSKIGLCPGSALNLNQAKPAPKQPNLEVGRCRRIHIQWLSDAGGTDF